ncbi:hypothetical protein [Paenibacillus illinoisensis]|uniref:Uncharacterized protein n=1 Tax=Paenibacillus illinoisensis TaxID=59845 RepID=A0A2W0CIV5_9BACL|nr:hypothetical protein [Paenibacillus illinoisensis]PYY28255.1 hypothetical protein PIL02S_03401 [Paenibacillus illinoisensis]
MTEDNEFKQRLLEIRKDFVYKKRQLQSYIGREVIIYNPELDLPRTIEKYEIDEIDFSENVVLLRWYDGDAQDWILEDISISDFVRNAEFYTEEN